MAEKKYWDNGTIPWVSSKDVKQPILSDTTDHITNVAVDEASMTVYPAGSVAIVTRSGFCGTHSRLLIFRLKRR